MRLTSAAVLPGAIGTTRADLNMESSADWGACCVRRARRERSWTSDTAILRRGSGEWSAFAGERVGRDLTGAPGDATIVYGTVRVQHEACSSDDPADSARL